MYLYVFNMKDQPLKNQKHTTNKVKQKKHQTF
jgi:hypothetical protein